MTYSKCTGEFSPTPDGRKRQDQDLIREMVLLLFSPVSDDKSDLSIVRFLLYAKFVFNLDVYVYLTYEKVPPSS